MEKEEEKEEEEEEEKNVAPVRIILLKRKEFIRRYQRNG